MATSYTSCVIQHQNYFQNETIQERVNLDNCITSSYLSIGVLLAGIITGRFGLWLSDVTITQVLQEKVQEEHRGIIGGVQDGMNSSMDTIKYLLVIALPENETFGWLIISSIGFVSLGAVSFIYYAIFQHDRKIPDSDKTNNTKTEYQIVCLDDPDNVITPTDDVMGNAKDKSLS